MYQQIEASVYYEIALGNPFAHLFNVTCVITQPTPTQRISLPNWIPGSYMIRDFAKNITTLSAVAGNQNVTIIKVNKNTWQIEGHDHLDQVRIQYQVYAWDLSVRSAHLDQTHGFFNGTSVFIKVQGQENNKHIVNIKKPTDEHYVPWRIATGMPRLSAAAYDFGEYYAENYDALIDYPVEMGDFSLVTFEACGVQHDVVITGHHEADLDRLSKDLKVICEHHIQFFGGQSPVDYYLFLVMTVGQGYGGLEHRNSCSLLCSRQDLPNVNGAKMSDDYLMFLGLCSHEYFHTWNVKRIKPSCFTPYQLDNETYTAQLWAYEGITSYYDDLSLTTTGLVPADRYLQVLGETITRVIRGAGRLHQSVAESSFDAWSKFYKQDENAPNAIVSYYTKGSLIALALDLKIRRTSNNEKSLDDVMRWLWEKFGDGKTGTQEGEIEAIIMQISGLDLADFFQRYLYGCEDLPLPLLLAEFGVDVSMRPSSNSQDKGGKRCEHDDLKMHIGVRYKEDEKTAILSHVFSDSPAQMAGLSAGDEVIAVNGIKVSRNSIEDYIAQFSEGQQLKMYVFRRDELMEMILTLLPVPLDTYYLECAESDDEDVLKRRKLWLNQ